MKENYIILKDRSRVFRLAFQSILYVNACGPYCQVLTTHLAYSVRCSFMELLDGILRDHLTRVHRSFAVNMRMVTGFSRSEVFIHTHRIPLSKAYFKEVSEQFRNST